MDKKGLLDVAPFSIIHTAALTYLNSSGKLTMHFKNNKAQTNKQ